MVKAELIKRSPLRVFEKSLHGGLGCGNVGVLASKKGVGKTACLVHIATDKLFNNKRVVHVSFSSKVDHIICWYEDIYKEIAKKRELEDAVMIHDELVRNRVIMNFNQETINIEQVLKSLSALIKDGKFTADAVIIDGFKFGEDGLDVFMNVKEFAKQMNIEVWFSVSLKGREPLFDDAGMPNELASFLGGMDVLITLRYTEDVVNFVVVKDHGEVSPRKMRLCLDPKTLLIAEVQ